MGAARGLVYAPNGNPIGTEKFAFKLAHGALHAHARKTLKLEERFVIAGDYNDPAQACRSARVGQ